MWQLFIVFYILLPLLVLAGVKIRPETAPLGKACSTELRGFGILLIVFAHAVAGRSNNATFFFYNAGVLGVGICFFLSGYGINKSFETKERYLERFLVPKFAKVLIPYLLLFIVSILFELFFSGEVQIKQRLYELVTLQMQGILLWYLKIQLLLYVFWYVSFRFFQRKAALFVLFSLVLLYMLAAWRFGLKLYWYNSCIFFPLGVLVSREDDRILPVLRSNAAGAVSGALFILLFGVLFFFGKLNIELLFDFAYIASFLCLCLFVGGKLSGSRLLSILGKCSMEAYLLHLLLLSTHLAWLFDPDKAWSYLLLLALTVLTSMPLYSVDRKLADLLIPTGRKKSEGPA